MGLIVLFWVLNVVLAAMVDRYIIMNWTTITAWLCKHDFHTSGEFCGWCGWRQ